MAQEFQRFHFQLDERTQEDSCSVSYTHLFGIAVPYFTSKDAKEGPISALLSVADIPRAAIGVEGGVTIDQVQQLVDGFKQALPGLVQVHGDELLAARKQALSHIKDGMTTAEKLLRCV